MAELPWRCGGGSCGCGNERFHLGFNVFLLCGARNNEGICAFWRGSRAQLKKEKEKNPIFFCLPLWTLCSQTHGRALCARSQNELRKAGGLLFKGLREKGQL